MNRYDPSEAADSDSILPAIREVFANPVIIPTGGLAYLLYLTGILSNIEEESALLKHLLDVDDETIGMGLSLYAQRKESILPFRTAMMNGCWKIGKTDYLYVGTNFGNASKYHFRFMEREISESGFIWNWLRKI